MRIKELAAAFLSYLQIKNHEQGSPYLDTWLQKEAEQFNSTVYYASSLIGDVLGNTTQPEQAFSDFFQQVHENCSHEAYRLGWNAVNGDLLKSEAPGILRKQEIFSPKEIPLIDKNNKKHREYLAIEKMPRFVDARLARSGLSPNSMTAEQKTKKMHRQKAWVSANDLFQIMYYVQAHIGKKESYYFLCAYYKLHYLENEDRLDSKAKQIAEVIEKVIDSKGGKYKPKFNRQKLELTSSEKKAYERVYINYPLPEEVPSLLNNYFNHLVSQTTEMQLSNQENLLQGVFDLIEDYIHIHPYLDANYRTITIVANALLSHLGYQYIDFHDSQIKSAMNTAFNQDKPDMSKAIMLLNRSLVNEQLVKVSTSGLYKQCKAVSSDQCLDVKMDEGTSLSVK
jgi:hypothetical protein